MPEESNLGPSDVARLLGVTAMTVRRLSDKGELPSFLTPGGHRRFMLEDVEAYCQNRGIPFQAQTREQKLRVLVVDDDRQYAEVIKEMLLESGLDLEVALAFGGFEAGLKVPEFNPELIITDLLMPDLNGIEMCRLLKSKPESQHIRVIGVTGQGTDDTVKDFIEAGADCCLVKPVPMSSLVELVTRKIAEARAS